MNIKKFIEVLLCGNEMTKITFHDKIQNFIFKNMKFISKVHFSLKQHMQTQIHLQKNLGLVEIQFLSNISIGVQTDPSI